MNTNEPIVINGGNVTINQTLRQAVQKAVDDSNIEAAAGVVITFPSGKSVTVKNQNSEIFRVQVTDDNGTLTFTDRPFEQGTRIEPLGTSQGN